MRFRDRRDAGRRLAADLRDLADRDDVIALALPRGGVPVAREVSDALHIALDVFIVRKLGVPGHRELAFGAIASGGVRVLNEDVVRSAALGDDDIERVAASELIELERREAAYGAAATIRDVVILVDGGLATGATMRAAVLAARARGALTVVAAAPVASTTAVVRVREVADEVRTVVTPEGFGSVGGCYDDFSELTDDDVRALLAR